VPTIAAGDSSLGLSVGVLGDPRSGPDELVEMGEQIEVVVTQRSVDAGDELLVDAVAT
jgi:hypothetical protein